MTIENFMEHLAFLVTYRGLWLVLFGINTLCLYKMFVRFAPVRKQWYWHLVLLFTLYWTSAVIIWVGDENLLYVLPAFLVAAMLCTSGNVMGRLTVNVTFICIIMSVNAMIDSFLGWQQLSHLFIDYYDTFTRLCRSIVWVSVWLIFRRRFPKVPPNLPQRIWRIVFGLSLMPLCSLVSIVLLTMGFIYISNEFRVLALRLAIAVLPFVFITSLVLLFAILILADHEALEQAQQISSMRELYYQGLQREQRQVRTLRHDLRNHLTVVMGLLEQNEHEKAIEYLQQLSVSPALSKNRQICENEAANVVLTSKIEDMERMGLECDFLVSLPKVFPISDIDLCALLGNALDNAMDAAAQASDPRIILRCRADKGMFMLRVENAMVGKTKDDLSTTKPDKTMHGFGLAGMREIADRYNGSLETRAGMGRFELIAAFPLK